jgi:hypothetical protein
MMTDHSMIFLTWWEKLNSALAVRGEPEALFGEAKDWYRFRPNWQNLEPSEPRIINQIINARKPA